MKKIAEKWLLYIIIGEMLIMLAVRVGAIIAVSVYAVQSDTMDNEDTLIHSFPDKLYYVSGKDSELDLTGGSLCFHPSPQDADGLACVQRNKKTDFHNTIPMDACSYETNIDFTQAGRYYVWFSVEYQEKEYILCAFPVDVIAPAEQGGEEK